MTDMPPLPVAALALVLLVAAQHAFFLVLEMFLWTKPLGMKVFRNSPEKAQATRVLAANQGLYNGFLAAGLVWAAVADRSDLALFFLGCVVVAGVYGAYSFSKRILYVQALPAALGIAAVLLG